MTMENNPGFSVSLDALYQDIILEHSKEPRNFKSLEAFDQHAEGYNPLCGDRIEVWVKLDKDKTVKECAFQGEGCSICMASASMMCEEAEGLSLDNVKNRIEEFRSVMQGADPRPLADKDLEALVGVRRFPVRIKCALLPWTTLKDAAS